MESQVEAKEMLVILGLPRSGTTLLTALLDAHSKVGLYYEPWNAFPKRPRPAVPPDLHEFVSSMEDRFRIALPAETQIVGFKETSTHMEAIEWSEATLDSLSRQVPCRLIWILRNPIHCYLSRVQGAREWWGVPEAEVSERSFVSFLHQIGPAISELTRMTQKYPSTLVHYEKLVTDPFSEIEKAMRPMGLQAEQSQLDYYSARDISKKVMGDPSLKSAPKAVSSEASRNRAIEAEAYENLFSRVLSRPVFNWIDEQFSKVFDPETRP